VKAIHHDGKMLLQFNFNYETLAKIKAIKGAKFHNKISKKLATGKVAHKKNVWTVPLTADNLKAVEEYGFEIGKSISKPKPKKKIVVNPIKKVDGLNADLYDYQAETLGFIKSRQGRALLALDPGSGKTVTSLAWLQYYRKGSLPALVVCPSAVRVMWVREALKFIPNIKVQELQGRKNYEILSDVDIIVINYDIITYWRKTLRNFGFKAMICDEIHYVKNSDSKRSKAVKSLSQKIPQLLGLTGTPSDGKNDSIWFPVHCIDPYLFPSRNDYRKRYCGLKAVPYGSGWDFSGSTNNKELHQILIDSVMIRKTREDVMSSLPEMVETEIPMHISNRKEYDKALYEFEDWLEEQDKKVKIATVLTQLQPLQQLAVEGKMDEGVKFVEDLLKNGKVVIFTTNKITIELLLKKFGKIAVVVDGSINATQKQKNIDAFVNNPKKTIFIGNIKSSGTGVDSLQRVCSQVVFFQRSWSPDQMDQARSRINRNGQKDLVSIFYLIAENTIEERIGEVLEIKQKNIEATVNGKGSVRKIGADFFKNLGRKKE